MSNNFQNATPLGPNNTETDVWLTPFWIIDKIGISDLDPCGWLPNEKSIVETAFNYFTEKENGLIQDWSKYKSVFVNFPYSQSYEWLEKCKLEANKGCEIIVLCFCRCETKAWQLNLKNCTGINLINKRIKFLTKDGVEKGNGNCPSCLIAFGEKSYQRIKNIDGLYFRLDKG